MKLLHALLIALFAVWAGASNAHPADEALCQKVFRYPQVKLAKDDEVERLATEFLRASFQRGRVIVCIGDNGPFEYAESATSIDERGSYFMIAFNAAFRLALGDEVRGIVGHEVAHGVSIGGRYCGDFHQVSVERYLECEHRVDREADTLAGDGQMERSLRFLIAYIERQHDSSRPEIHRLLSGLKWRVSAMRHKRPAFLL